MAFSDKPRKPLQRKTPLSSGGSQLKRTPLKQVSDKRAASGDAPRGNTFKQGSPMTSGSGVEAKPRKKVNQMSEKRKQISGERSAIARAIKSIQPICVVPSCNQESTDAHERLTRGRGGSIVNPYNIVGLCRRHHTEITDEAKWAYPLGLLLHGWDEEPTEPCHILSEMQKLAVEEVVISGWRPKSPYDVELWYEKRRAA